jgi:hypothetical protein
MEKKYFFDDPKNVKGFFWLFYMLLGFFTIGELFIHKHTYFPWEKYPFFFAAFGFVSFVIMILFSKYVLRPLIKRKENYYD